jgi:outer membrane protein assembly factor BamB/predicted MPP superfamily phosphohydrolase
VKKILWGLVLSWFALASCFAFGLVYKKEGNLAYTDLGAGDLALGTRVYIFRPNQNYPYTTATIRQVAQTYATFFSDEVQVGDRVRTDSNPPLDDELIFVHLADTHFGTARGTQNSLRIIAELKDSPISPAFVLVGGDITDQGTREHFSQSQVLRSLPYPVYTVPGNHDLRWAEGGKELYRKWWGDPYYSFQAGTYKFIALDSSIRMEQYGHVEKAQLDWLAEELKDDKEKILFLHHPVARGSNSGQVIVDNEAEVLNLLSRGKARLLISSHLHNYQFRQANGVFAVVSPAAINEEYLIVNLSGGRTTIFTKQLGGEFVLRHSFTSPSSDQLKILSPQQKSRWQGAVPLELVLVGNSSGTLEIAVDDKKELSVSIEARGQEVPWQTLLLGDWTAGWHKLSVRYQTKTGYWEEQRSFFFQPAQPSPKLSWEFQAKGDLQAGPAASPETLLVTTLNGWVQCLDRQDGSLLWERHLGSPLVGGAAWGDGAFYLGSEAGGFYSFTEAGALRWSLTLDGSILTRPVLADNLVLVGAGTKLVAVEAQTGNIRWQKDLGGLIEAPPLVVGNMVYATSWEGSIAALRLADGRQSWLQKLDMGIYAPGGATPALADGVLLVSTPRRIWGLNPKDGSALWQLEEKLLYAPLGTNIGGLQVAGTLNRELIGINIRGAKLWQMQVPDLFTGPGPVGSGEKAYQVALSGTVYQLWHEAGLKAQPILKVGNGFVLGEPFYDGSQIYFTDLSGKVAAWKLNDGR